MISPFKAILGGDYKGVEARLQRAIHIRFGLPSDLPETVTKAIKAADRLSAHAEAMTLAGFTPDEANTFFGRPKRHRVDPADLAPLPAKDAQARFLERFAAVDGECLKAARRASETIPNQGALAEPDLRAQEG